MALPARTMVYIHWPYCTKLCTYCNFNKYRNTGVDHARMLCCLLTEWRTLRDQYRNVADISISGGKSRLMLSSKEQVNLTY